MDVDLDSLLEQIDENSKGIENVQISDEELKKNFVYHYTNNFYKTKTNDPLLATRYTRRCMAQAVSMAHKTLDNHASCYVLESQFKKYASMMDNKKGVNNLANIILAQPSSAGGSRSEGPTAWVSKGDYSSLFSKIPPEVNCANKGEDGVCPSSKVTDEDIQILLQNKKKNEIALKLQDNIANEKKTGSHVVNKPTQSLVQGTNSANETDKVIPVQKDAFLQTVGNRVFGQKRNVPSTSIAERFVKKPKSCSNFGNEDVPQTSSLAFRTAGTELKFQNLKKYGSAGPSSGQGPGECTYGSSKKSLGGRARSVNSKFVPPVRPQDSEEEECENNEKEKLDERLQLIDPQMVELIQSEIIDNGVGVGWDDIAGLNFAKNTLKEIVVLPMLRPDIFTGLRRPPKGILLFGPPGTGKTLIGKCVASQSKSTFFSISASSLTSKWIGVGEKMVKALFTVARVYQPAVIFIDEIDSLLGQRGENEHESSRRLKTEFLIHLDGTGTKEDERILLIGATNRPQDLDEAVRRRFVRRLYIPLPDQEARAQIIKNLLSTEKHNLSSVEIENIAQMTEGYSAADMKSVCQEASMGPLRSMSFTELELVSPSEVRPVVVDDFKSALACVRSSVAQDDLSAYVKWDEKYGAGGAPK